MRAAVAQCDLYEFVWWLRINLTIKFILELVVLHFQTSEKLLYI